MHIYIRAMSESQNKIYDKLTDKSDQILIHLAKLLIYPNCQYVNHWKKEIMSFLWRVDKLKGKNKYPSEKFIVKALSTHNDVLAHYISHAIDAESELQPNQISSDTFERAAKEYQHWLAKMLSQQGVIDASLIYSELDEIVRKYSN